MWGWIGANSNGNITTGLGFRLGGGGQREADGCIPQALGCFGAIVFLVATAAILWLIVSWVGSMTIA